MKKSATHLQVIATLLTLVAIGHLGRVILGWEILIEGWMLPWWVSVLAGLIVGKFAIYLWRSSSK